MTDGPETPPNYEEQFAHRFSLEDPEYQQYVSRPANPPPLVEDWGGRGGGNNRGRDNRCVSRGWGGAGSVTPKQAPRVLELPRPALHNLLLCYHNRVVLQLGRSEHHCFCSIKRCTPF
uniref:RNMT-activating mini protein n=1 Tax=Oncorhynchus mykiss TaxID=8022 RepID=A0A8C7WBS1_ONCMY